MRALLSIVFLATAACSIAADDTSRVLSLCDVVRNWEAYDGKDIQIKGIFAVGPEVARLYDPGCCNQDAQLWVEFIESRNGRPTKERAQLKRYINADSRAKVVFKGRFEGPKAVAVPDTVHPDLRERIRDLNSRHGHMNAYRFKIVVREIQKVERVDRTTP